MSLKKIDFFLTDFDFLSQFCLKLMESPSNDHFKDGGGVFWTSVIDDKAKSLALKLCESGLGLAVMSGASFWSLA